MSGWNANLTLRALATYIDTRSASDGITVDESVAENSGGVARWRLTTSIGYQQGPVNAQFTARSVSKGVYDRAFTPTTLANNHIAGATYCDLGLSWKMLADQTGEIFLNVDNVFDRDPVIVSPTAQQFLAAPINATLYDTLGREYRAGVRLRF